MPDEPIVAVETADAPIVETPEVTADTFSDKAKEKGWKPLEEYDGDPDEWVDAKEFCQRAPLYDRLKNQNKKLKEQEKALRDMGSHIDKVSQAAYNRAISDLQKEKREAVSVADVDRVEEIDKEIQEIKQEMVPPKQQPGIAPEIVAWTSDKENQWFNEDAERREFAIAYQQAQLQTHPDMDIETSLKNVNKAVRKAFPEKFSNPARSTAAVVETAVSRTDPGKKVYSYKDLSEEQRSVAARFDRMGIMSKDEYVKQLAENGMIGA